MTADRLQIPAVRQRGVVMWVGLVVLVVMTLAGLTMLRQLGSGISTVGNLAFKENATSVADYGTEAARRWLLSASETDFDLPASGYYANWGTSVDPTTFDWSARGSIPVTLDPATGNSVRYVVHRLCQNQGPSAALSQRCSDVEEESGESKGGLGYGVGAPPPGSRPYYRVTVQVLGPRSTVAYTQVVMQ